MRVDLLRHGETGRHGFYGRTDIPLIQAGWQSMHEAVAACGPWDAIVSSPLVRCAHFARALATQRSCPLHLDADWAEYDFGVWEGLSPEEVHRNSPVALARFWRNPWNNEPLHAETMEKFQQRVDAAQRRLQYQPWHHVLVVTHAGVIRLWHWQKKILPTQNFLAIDIPFASLHSFELRARK